eukprot:12097448-Karenia_brevis.AAC.1
MTTTPPTSGPGPSGNPMIEGSQHGSGADRSDQLGLSPDGARGEADLFGGVDLRAASGAVAIDDGDEADLHSKG